MPVGELIRRNASDAERCRRPFLWCDNARISHAQYYEESVRWAKLFRQRQSSLGANDASAVKPVHVGVLLDNQPDYFFALGGAALAGAVIVGINNTKRGSHLARDIAHTDCQLLITESKYLAMLSPILEECNLEPSQVLLSTRWDDELAEVAPARIQVGDLERALASGEASDPRVPIGDSDTFVLVFTSGTVTAPKAVRCSHGRMVETGKNVGGNVYGMTIDDVGYVAMPLFHANSLMCAYMPALYYGASLAMTRKFSKTRWLSDIRRYRATFFNYTGKPLAYILSTPRCPDDAENRLRICYGNEGSHQVVEEFQARFGCRVIDVFGSSEGGAGVTRQTGDPPNSIGMPAFGIIVADANGNEKPCAQFDDNGCLLNPDDAIGEIVNTQGTGWFEGYYKNDEAFAQRTRNGWYWSGDLGYRDAEGYLYFAGRDIEWIRVDGENFIARPIEEILQRHPDIILAAVYGVPDPDGGDRVMAALILREGIGFDAAGFAAFMERQADLSPKWMPTYLRIASELPQTATSKILKTTLRKQKFRPDDCTDAIYWRTGAREAFHLLLPADYERLRRRFESTGRAAQLEI